MALVHDMGEALIGDITPSDGISRGKCCFRLLINVSNNTVDEKYLREEMAMKFLAYTIRPSNSHFADLILELWYEYETGETQASRLVRQMDKLECIDQAVLYEERSGLDLSDFMTLKEQITLPELQPWLKIRLQNYADLKLKKTADITVVFISGTIRSTLLYH